MHRTTTRWTAPTPGFPAWSRLRFAAADGSDGTVGAGAPPAAPAAPAAPPAAPTTPVPTLPVAPVAGEQPPAPNADGLPDDPTALKALIADLRKENASSRTNAKAQAAQTARDELVQQLGEALGLIKKGDPAPDPAALTAEIGTARADLRTAAIELAAYKAAGALGANPTALLDSRSFLAKVADLDPKAEDFTTKVSAAITTALTENPLLKMAPVAGPSGVAHAGGTGEGASKPTTLEGAIAQRMAAV